MRIDYCRMYKKEQYIKVIDAAKERLAEADAAGLAAARGFAPSEPPEGADAAFDTPFFTDVHKLLLPSLDLVRANGAPASKILHSVVLHHLEAPGGRLTGKFISYVEMPGLAPYRATIKWRVYDVLARAFGDSPARLLETAPALGGEKLPFGDSSALFRPLPQIPIQVIVWGEDEIEPAAANVLFDESALRLLPLEDLVALGEIAAHRIKAAAIGARTDAPED